MRRKTSYLAYSAVLGIIIILIIYYFYLRRTGVDLLKSEDRKKLDVPELLRLLLLGGLSGGIIGSIKYEYDRKQEEKYPFCADQYLINVLEKESLFSDPRFLETINGIKQDLKSALYFQFAWALTSPIKETGSFSSDTAVFSDFDIDLIIFFRRESFASLEEMYYGVYEFLKQAFPDAEVLKQRKTIGLNFDINGTILHFDIVPVRQIDRFNKTNEANLFRKGTWFFDKPGSFKTRVDFNTPPKYNTKIAEIIKLGKAYKIKNNLNLPSIVIERSACDWLLSENKFETNSITQNFLSYLLYLRKVLQREFYVDPKNSNNNLMKGMTQGNREKIIGLIENDTTKIFINPRELPEVFLNDY